MKNDPLALPDFDSALCPRLLVGPACGVLAADTDHEERFLFFPASFRFAIAPPAFGGRRSDRRRKGDR